MANSLQDRVNWLKWFIFCQSYLVNTVRSEYRISYPKILLSEHRHLLPLSHKFLVIQISLSALIACPFWGQAHRMGWSRTHHACFVTLVFFCPKSELLSVSESFGDCSSPIWEAAMKDFYCKICSWDDGDCFSGLQIAASHFIPRGFSMKIDTICACQWICWKFCQITKETCKRDRYWGFQLLYLAAMHFHKHWSV